MKFFDWSDAVNMMKKAVSDIEAHKGQPVSISYKSLIGIGTKLAELKGVCEALYNEHKKFIPSNELELAAEVLEIGNEEFDALN
jgi:hypothetical protein